MNIPTYSTTSENVMVEEYVQGQPMYIQGGSPQGVLRTFIIRKGMTPN